ncbi:MAG: LPXTG cell wall anchor domain-containing protein, partial [Clostridia bacterium]|nr:LPXTG cell wall anchor domain-containing protein [Clostridia bacterium]
VIANAIITEATRTEAPGKFTRITIDETVQAYYVGITNAPGSALPETGGMGTTLFTILGIVLMAGAVAFFTSRKRSSVA